MYVADQPPFLNAVAELRTDLRPRALLGALQGIERALGRGAGGARYGPRPVDLDIVLFDGEVVDDGDALTVPHPRLRERAFVLRPLCDIDDGVVVPEAGVPGRGRPARELLAALSADPRAGMTRVLPLRASTSGLLEWGGRPKMMGIINATPDSFSDGGEIEGVDAAVRRAEEFARFGFEIVDVGGQSTRPGAALVSEREERSRVEPVVRAIRDELPSLAISVDTFRAGVAEAAADAGADIVNDVSAGRLDPRMPAVVRATRCAWALMHMRGTPETMMEPAATDYGPGGVVAQSAAELAEAVAGAAAAGVPRWDVMVDPGFGFAKTAEQTRDLARALAQWTVAVGDYPCLVGISRKSALTRMIPRLRNEGASMRDFATAGAIVAAMYCGADMLRVHNPRLVDSVTAAYELHDGNAEQNPSKRFRDAET